MRIGILGGTFDPPHDAHVALAKAAQGALALDRILVVPSGDPPYKKCRASAADRLEMARAAFADVGAAISDIEIGRVGATYAVDTVRALKGMYPGAALVYILGADAISKVRGWAGYDELKGMCAFAYAARGDAGAPDVEAARIEATLDDISSSAVRERVAVGADVRGLVPAGVADYIWERGLYLADRAEEELIADLEARLSARRFAHSLCVRETAMELARIHGAAVGKARIAGLLHDCAKYMTDAELRAHADAAGADAAEKESPQVLHAPVGAHLARTRYGVRDREVLSAIRRHTVGGAEMGLLDMIVYVADYIEPSRADFPGLDGVRALAREDIRVATLACARQTCDYTDRRGRCAHPATAEMICALEE